MVSRFCQRYDEKNRYSLEILKTQFIFLITVYKLTHNQVEFCYFLSRYGIKEVNKIKRLSGPGLDTADVPGVMQGGGKWPER